MDKLLIDNPTQAWLVRFCEEGKEKQRILFAPEAKPAIKRFMRQEPAVREFELEAVYLFDILPAQTP